MRTTTSFALALAALLSAFPATADDCCGNNPDIRSIDRTCLPVGPPNPNIALYRSDLEEHYQEVAYIDSFVSTDRCEDTTRRQLKDLQAKGSAIGADALIRVRPLENKIRGWKENPDTPFFSVEQGASDDYFFRATAIKYLHQPKGAPKQLPVRVAKRGTARQSSPLIDTNRLLKQNEGRTQRNEVTVPEVYTTQQPQGSN